MPDLDTLLILGSINALLAWSMWLPLATGQISFGTAGAAATGGYTLAWLNLHSSLGLAERLVAAAAAGAITLLIAGLFGLRIKGFALGMVTLAISEIIVVSIALIPDLGGPIGLSGLDLVDHVKLIAIVAVIVILVVNWRIFHGQIGRRLDAVADSELHASALGIRTKRVHVVAFAISGAAAGLAGGLTVSYAGFVDPSVFQLALNVSAFSAVIVGGMTVYYGPIFGAFLLTALTNSTFIHVNQDMLIGIALIVAVLVRREGVLRRSRWLQRVRVRRLIQAKSTRA